MKTIYVEGTSIELKRDILDMISDITNVLMHEDERKEIIKDFYDRFCSVVSDEHEELNNLTYDDLKDQFNEYFDEVDQNIVYDVIDIVAIIEFRFELEVYKEVKNTNLPQRILNILNPTYQVPAAKNFISVKLMKYAGDDCVDQMLKHLDTIDDEMEYLEVLGELDQFANTPQSNKALDEAQYAYHEYDSLNEFVK